MYGVGGVYRGGLKNLIFFFSFGPTYFVRMGAFSPYSRQRLSSHILSLSSLILSYRLSWHIPCICWCSVTIPPDSPVVTWECSLATRRRVARHGLGRSRLIPSQCLTRSWLIPSQCLTRSRLLARQCLARSRQTTCGWKCPHAHGLSSTVMRPDEG